MTNDDKYMAAGHRVQSAVLALMQIIPKSSGTDPKHLRTGIDMSKADMAGLVTLLIDKGVFTKAEYIEAITKSAEEEANRYEKILQSVLGNRGISTL